LPRLDDVLPPGRGRPQRIVLGVLRSPAHRLLSGGLVELRYTAATGAPVVLPVQAAPLHGDGRGGIRLVVVPAQAASKRWWRHFRTPAAVAVLRGGVLHPEAIGRVLGLDDPQRRAAVAAYRARWPRVVVAAEDPVVLLELG
jgi:hypothetical protein